MQKSTLTTLSVHGITDPDDAAPWPAVRDEYRDGATRTKYKGFRRLIDVGFEVISDSTEEHFLLAFLDANFKSVTYGNEDMALLETIVAPQDAGSYATQWDHGFKEAKLYSLKLLEDSIRTLWPLELQVVDGDPSMIVYMISHVQVVGTRDNPELFTTNSGKLLYNYGTTPFPEISLLSYQVSIGLTKCQERGAAKVGTVTQNGPNISFYLGLDTFGNDDPTDGSDYFDIRIELQPI